MKSIIVAAHLRWTVSLAHMVIFLLTFCVAALPAEAQPGTYPSRQLQIIVPFPAGVHQLHRDTSGAGFRRGRWNTEQLDASATGFRVNMALGLG